MPGPKGCGSWIFLGLLSLLSSLMASDISAFDFSVIQVRQIIVSHDGHAKLHWAVDSDSTADLFRITETGPGGQHTSFVDGAQLNVYRIEPGNYHFDVQACSRYPGPFPRCEGGSQRLTLSVTESVNELFDVRQKNPSVISRDFEDPAAFRGPGQLRPGLWYNPERNGHGWSFYWANRLALPESHALHGDEYDLLGVWYSYEAKSRYQDGPLPCGEGYFGSECYWTYDHYLPVAAMLKLVQSSETTYSGGIYITRNSQETQVGSATITFDGENENATVVWSANFKWQQLTATDPIALLSGTIDDSVSNLTHYSGFWQPVGREDLFVIDDVGFYGEAVEVVFEDAKGDPGWIQAANGFTPDAGETSLCFYYIQQGYAPDSTGPILYHNSGCDPTREANDSNRNGARAFTDFESAGLWLDFGLPDTLARGNVSMGISDQPVSLTKAASFHRISFSFAPGPVCETTQSQTACAVLLSWFTDGDYPQASVFDLNLNSATRRLITTSDGQATTDYPYSVSELGQHRFELRMGDTADSTLIAVSSLFEVSDAAMPTPYGLKAAWLDLPSRQFALQWSHADPANVGWYELEESPPGGAPVGLSTISPGTVLERIMTRQAGPFGDYLFRVRACAMLSGQTRCSEWSASLNWNVSDPAQQQAEVIHPWGSNAANSGALVTDNDFHYAMGYHFRPETDGMVTELGGLFNGAYPVRLFRRTSGELLAQATVSADNNWKYASITPVSVIAGEEYTVAVYLDGVGGSYRTSTAFPGTFSGITIVGSTFISTDSNPNAIPVNVDISRMYGQADIGFVEGALDENLPPEIDSSLPDREDAQGDTVSLLVNVSDPDGDVVACNFQNLPGGLTESSECQVDGAVTGAPGVYETIVTASDGQQQSQPSSFTWTIVAADAAARPDTPLAPAAKPDSAIDAVSARVGATPGEASVDPSGAAIYRVPLMTAAGSGGFAPALSLEYNSQFPNGVLGMGWTLGGLSAITRCAATIEQDSNPASIGTQFTYDDRYCLDGQRLMLVAGQYGHAGSEYRTEIDSFTRVIAYGTAENGPIYFKAWTRDGMVSEYGQTSDSRIEVRAGEAPDTVVSWARNRVQDAAGNYALYEYAENAIGPVDFELQTIRYTGNERAGTSPHAEIRLHYAVGRNDVPVSFTRAVSFTTSRLLTRIDSLAKIDAGDAVMKSLRSYFLEYGEDGYGRKTLESLAECSDSTRAWCFPETEIAWLKNEHGIDRRNTYLKGVFPDIFSGLAVADVNGDRRPDLLISQKSSQSASFKIAFATEQGGFAVNPITYSIPVQGEDATPVTLRTIDLNADSFQDVIYPKSFAGTISWYARLSDGNRFGSEFNVAYGCCELLDPSVVRIMDYDGDGLADLVTNRHSSGNDDNGDLVVLRNAFRPGGPPRFESYRKLQIELDSNLFPEGPTTAGWIRDDEAPQFVNANPVSAVGAQPFDFNGDGRVDLVAKISRRYLKCEIKCPLPVIGTPGEESDSSFRFVSSEDDSATQDTLVTKGLQVGHATFYVVFESWGDDEFREHSIIATGANEDCNVYEVCNPFAHLPAVGKLLPVDINADGLADIAFMDGGYDWYFMLNTGGSILPPVLIASPPVDENSEKGEFLDVNGDGLPELIYPSLDNDTNANWVQHTNVAGKVFAAAVVSRMYFGNPAMGDASILVDFSGDGMLDNLFFGEGRSIGSSRAIGQTLQLGENLITGTPSQASSVITKITNGLGAIHRFEYQPLTSSVYTRMKNSGAVEWGRHSPVFDLSAPVYVVSRYSQSAPVYGNPEALSMTEYHYVGGKIQAGGRGFLGFAEVIAYDPQNGIRTNTRYRQDFPFTGMLTETTTASVVYADRFKSVANPAILYDPVWPEVSATTQPSSQVTGTVIRYQAHEWSAQETVAGKGTYHPQLVATVERNYTLAGRLSRKDFTSSEFDNVGQVTSQSAQTWGSDSGSAILTRTTQNTYTTPNMSAWKLGQLSDSRVTHARPGTASITRQKTYQYDIESMQMVRETTEPGNAQLQLVRDFELDDFGNRIAVSTSGSDVDTRRQTFDYDALGRHVDREVNALGQVTNQVLQRDVYGTELLKSNIDGVLSEVATEPMGRPFFSYNENGSWKKAVHRLGRGSHCPSGTTYHAISSAGGTPGQVTCYDRVGREIRTATEGFDGGYIYTDRYHDSAGRLERESAPFFQGDTQYWTIQSYDSLGRPALTESAAGDDLVYVWDSDGGNRCAAGDVRMVLTRNALGQEKLEIRNALGETVSVYDEQCGLIRYSYDAMGQLVSTTGADGVEIITAYDSLGRKIMLDDPDKGLWRYAYNPHGELMRQLDSKGQAIDFEYDQLGRITDRRELKGVSSLTSSQGTVVNHEHTIWQNATQSWITGKGQVGQIIYYEGENGAIVHQHDLIYDDFGRVRESLTLVDGQQFRQETTFDQFGRPFQQFDASGGSRGLRFIYQPNGYLAQIREAREGANGTVYQHVKAMDARGNVTWMQMGNGVEAFATYSPSNGFLEKLEAYDAQGVELQEVDYLFDLLGTLTQRSDQSNGRDLTEDFSYDSLNRLVRVELTAPADYLPSPVTTLSLNYDAGGNIRYKSDVGTYTYGEGNAGPHAVSWAGSSTYAYDANGNQVSGGGRTITYSVFDKPLTITGGGQKTDFDYGIGNQRIRRVDDNHIDGSKTTLYLGAVERIESDGEIRFRRSLAGVASADYYPVSGIQSIRYFIKDHLGSIHNVTDESGLIQNATWMSFDSFGQRRDVDWQSSLPLSENRALTDLSNRGFTGHEHVDSMGIIHMNGRIYDPKLGRFLQADPLVQSPKNSQSLNRYSYALNNPLSYTDPSGYFSLKRFFKKWGRLIIAAVAAYFTFGAAYLWAANAIASGVSSSLALAKFVGAVGWKVVAGSIAGAASGFVAGAITSGSLKGAVRGAFAGAITGGIASYYGNTYNVERIASESLGGGASAKILGGKFEDGLKFALIVSVATYLNYRMDQSERANSSKNPDNLNKPGSGLYGEEHSIAGARRTVVESGSYAACGSPAGGCQGLPIPGNLDQTSNLVGLAYDPQGPIGYVVDTFAGPHDWFRNHVSRSYDLLGNSRRFTGFRKLVDEIANGVLIPVAAPFSAGALVGTLPFLNIALLDQLYDDN